MTTTMHEPFTAGPAREGIAARLLVPAFWGAVSIVAIFARSIRKALSVFRR